MNPTGLTVLLVPLAAIMVLTVDASVVIGDYSDTDDVENYDENHSYYNVNIGKYKVVNGKPQMTVDVWGYGIKDSIIVSGDMVNIVYTNNQKMMAGNTTEGIYTDTIGTLVLLKDGRCVQRTYQKGTAPVSSAMSEQECDDVKASMKAMQQKLDKWSEDFSNWSNQFTNYWSNYGANNWFNDYANN